MQKFEIHGPLEPRVLCLNVASFIDALSETRPGDAFFDRRGPGPLFVPQIVSVIKPPPPAPCPPDPADSSPGEHLRLGSGLETRGDHHPGKGGDEFSGGTPASSSSFRHDLGRKFGLTDSPVTDRTCIVIVEANINESRTVMGVIADSVSQVISMSEDKILPAPAFGTRVRIDFLRGMGKSGDKFVLILDIDKVLSADDLTPTASGVIGAEQGALAALNGNS